ncbi:MAG TPA: tetratricopeptide repeat protein [Bacteroidia bacterium]|nr:tetratricopeptide repeat protein [Bacteroidia bacterium]
MKLIFKLSNYCVLKLACLFIFCLSSNSFSQTKNKEWLLVDGIDYAHLNGTDKQLLDSILPLYHKATHDSVRLRLLNDFVENCVDEAVWPKYNNFMQHMAESGDGSKLYLIYQAAALNNIGYDADNKGNVILATEYYTKALTLREKAGDIRGIAESTNNLGSLCSFQNDTKKSIFYYAKAVKLYQSIGDKRGASQSLNNLGSAYNNLNKVDSGIIFNMQGLSMQQEIGDDIGMANSYSNLGSCYLDKGDTLRAIEYYTNSLKIDEELGNKTGIAEALNNLGEIYLTRNDIKKAQAYGDRAFLLAQELGYPNDIGNSAKLLYDVYRKLKNTGKALDMYILFKQMRDSVTGLEQVRATTTAEYTYKEFQQNLEHEKQSAIATEERKKQRLFMLLIACIAIATGVIALLVFKNLQRYKKAKRLIEKQKELVEEKQKEILDSIRYAKRIQDAVLKEQEHISAHLPSHFVLFQPKDIVSGDFYWAIEKDNYWYVAAADCTGHGVPGAFLTILGTSFLNELNATDTLLTPAEILDKLRSRMIAELSVTNKETNETKDGMDISLARLNLATKELMWAGANNPLWITSIINQNVDKKEYKLTEISAHKQPIGFYPTITPYPNHIIQLNKGDTFYLFTDGYADQFGGEKGKKLKYKPIKDILINAANKSMEEQKKILLDYFIEWKGNYEQTDDICIIGINIY